MNCRNSSMCLRGEMSLVGPRPCLPYEYERYLPWQKERFASVPGLTGLWQVSGKNRTTFVEMIQLDIQYAREKSLWFDLGILLSNHSGLDHSNVGNASSARKLSRPVRSETVLSRSHPASPYSLRKSAFAEVVRAERQAHLNLRRKQTKVVI